VATEVVDNKGKRVAGRPGARPPTHRDRQNSGRCALVGINLDVAPARSLRCAATTAPGSVLVKTIAASTLPDSARSTGTATRTPALPKDAAELGIETVYQDLACDNLDIVQNMYLGRTAPALHARRRTHGAVGAGNAAQPRGDHCNRSASPSDRCPVANGSRLRSKAVL
jgi:hypothetical protein